MPEAGLDQINAAFLYAPLLPSQQRRGQPSPLPPPDYGRRYLTKRARDLKQVELAYLPWRKEPDCQLGKESADRLHVLSLYLRNCLRASTPGGDIRPDPDRLRNLLLQDSLSGGFSPLQRPGLGEIKPSEWRQPGAVPVLVQLLQHENTPIRLLLVELLSQIEGKEASVALAQRALFDLSPEVREKAVRALGDRPAAEYRHVLLNGFRYPWPPVADHAAEAVAALEDRDTLPALIDLLAEPDPRRPIAVKDGDREVLFTRELVRINHLSNCMICHAPSFSRDDLVRGRVPIPGEDPPPLYYAETSGLFVRADITYLRQDFSVVQPVTNSGKWPGNQRFDYLIRTRPLTGGEWTHFEQRQKEKPGPNTYEQREALLFAIRELTGKDLGSSYEDWKGLLKPKVVKEEDRQKDD
ncbi:MAG TPA: HEAT repeat domain-containing protein [Gemmataceae bacterium]|nr:HEAT repeat domain-containing protein [Gemmataceae bacterium]